MNTAASQPNEFASLLQRFFIERLMQQQNASPRTVESYRDTFRLLLNFAQQRLKRPPEKLTFVEFNSALITDFLDHLETVRRNSIRSRNARLAAVHAFCHFVAMQCPPALHVAQQILSIPSKRFEKPLLGFLTREEVQALLAAPDPATWFGQRDRAMLLLMYNTGARVSELTGILVADVTLTGVQWVRLRGKGRKQRTVPLWDETGRGLCAWISNQGLKPEQPLLPNRYGRPMTRANVAERFGLAVAIAGKTCPQLLTRHVSPHSMRHYLPFLTMSRSWFGCRARSLGSVGCGADCPGQLQDIVSGSTDCSGTQGACPPACSDLASLAAARFSPAPVPSSQASHRDRSASFPPIRVRATMQSRSGQFPPAEGP